MDIITVKSGALYVLRLTGRLDASWCGHVKASLDSAVRAGEHQLQLDFAGVTYISSAGIRVLLSTYKQLKAIGGQLAVVDASKSVGEVLELAGLSALLLGSQSVAAVPSTAGGGRAHESASARFEVFEDGAAEPVRVSLLGNPSSLVSGVDEGNPLQPVRFAADSFALGVGALAADAADASPRLGELLAVAGSAAYQPADGSTRPDFMVSEGSLVPQGHLLVGLTGDGLPQRLARFEATSERRTVGISEIAATALELAGSQAVALIAVTETAGLVGASLRQSPAQAGDRASRFGYPGVRDWLSFSGERTHRDSTSLIVGVVARPGTHLDPMLRPMAAGSGLVGHMHAGAFPYRPLRKGRIELAGSVASLFEASALQSILHLLSDSREIVGAGESEFYRGALWLAPIRTTQT
jgi:anti-anti-sigma factor